MAYTTNITKVKYLFGHKHLSYGVKIMQIVTQFKSESLKHLFSEILRMGLYKLIHFLSEFSFK